MSVLTSPDSHVEIGSMGLYVPLDRETNSYFNYYWLRDNCPSSFDPETRERTFDIVQLDNAPKAAAAYVDSDDLIIEWRDDAHVTRMPLDLLKTYATGQRRADPADLPRKAWYADHYPAIARFTLAELKADPAKLKSWLEAIIVEGISIVTDMPDTDAALTELVHLMGQIRPTFFGEYFDIRTHINPSNLGYTSAALELHTDTPAEENAPGVQFLHMRANTVDGGMNMLGDGVAVADDFRQLDPEGFRLLSEIDVPFFCEHDTFDMRSYHRVIELDHHGAVSGLTYSQHMLDLIDLPQHSLDDYYPAFCRFGKLLQNDKYIIKCRLQATECVVFDNHRVVHGRTAFTASSGQRHMRGTYADRAEMRSTYRSMVSEGRFKA